MRTGMMTSPIWAVRALNSLQNCMMLRPCWPSAGPTGGDGLALPAGHWSLMSAVIFFMTLRLLYLGEVELDRRGAPEDRDQDLHLLLVRLHFLDGGREAGERAVDDADGVALLEHHLRLGLRLALAHRRVDPRDVLLRDRRRVGAAEEAGDLGGVLD